MVLSKEFLDFWRAESLAVTFERSLRRNGLAGNVLPPASRRKHPSIVQC